MLASLIAVLLTFPLSVSAFSECKMPDQTQSPLRGKPFTVPEATKAMMVSGYSAQAEVQRRQPLRALIWNIYKAKRSDLWSVAGELSQQNHFALFQEAIFEPAALQHYCSRFPYRFVSAISFWQTNSFGTGISTGAVFSEVQRIFQRSRWREPFVNTPKVALLTKYRISGVEDQTLLMVNIHGINFVLDKGLRDQLDALAGVIAEHKGPVIVGGDFNTHTTGRKRILNGFAKTLGLQHLDLEFDERNMKLDHVLVRGVHVTRAYLLNHVRASDHKPIQLEFQLL